jgi:hypothetical protein
VDPILIIHWLLKSHSILIIKTICLPIMPIKITYLLTIQIYYLRLKIKKNPKLQLIQQINQSLIFLPKIHLLKIYPVIIIKKSISLQIIVNKWKVYSLLKTKTCHYSPKHKVPYCLPLKIIQLHNQPIIKIIHFLYSTIILIIPIYYLITKIILLYSVIKQHKQIK